MFWKASLARRARQRAAQISVKWVYVLIVAETRPSSAQPHSPPAWVRRGGDNRGAGSGGAAQCALLPTSETHPFSILRSIKCINSGKWNGTQVAPRIQCNTALTHWTPDAVSACDTLQLPDFSCRVTGARLEGEGARDHFTLCQCSFCSSDWAARASAWRWWGELSWSNIWLKHLVVIMRCFQRIIQGEGGGTASSQHWIKQPLWFNRMTFLSALLNNSFGISCQIQGPAKSRLLLVYSC